MKAKRSVRIGLICLLSVCVLVTLCSCRNKGKSDPADTSSLAFESEEQGGNGVKVIVQDDPLSELTSSELEELERAWDATTASIIVEPGGSSSSASSGHASSGSSSAGSSSGSVSSDQSSSSSGGSSGQNPSSGPFTSDGYFSGYY